MSENGSINTNELRRFMGWEDGEEEIFTSLSRRIDKSRFKVLIDVSAPQEEVIAFLERVLGDVRSRYGEDVESCITAKPTLEIRSNNVLIDEPCRLCGDWSNFGHLHHAFRGEEIVCDDCVKDFAPELLPELERLRAEDEQRWRNAAANEPDPTPEQIENEIRRCLASIAGTKPVRRLLQIDGWHLPDGEDSIMRPDGTGHCLTGGYTDELRLSDPSHLPVRIQIDPGATKETVSALLKKAADWLDRDWDDLHEEPQGIMSAEPKRRLEYLEREANWRTEQYRRWVAPAYLQDLIAVIEKVAAPVKVFEETQERPILTPEGREWAKEHLAPIWDQMGLPLENGARHISLLSQEDAAMLCLFLTEKA